MGKFLIRVIIGTLGLWSATVLLPGLRISSDGTQQLTQGNRALSTLLAFLFIGLIFGIVNALVKPLVRVISLPVTLLSLGLFTIVINATMLWLTSWLSSFTPVPLSIDRFFWTAILAAIVISLITMIGNAVTGINRRD